MWASRCFCDVIHLRNMSRGRERASDTDSDSSGQIQSTRKNGWAGLVSIGEEWESNYRKFRNVFGHLNSSLISVSMLWKPISLQSRVFFGADTAMCSESLKFWKKLCIGLIISGLLLGSKDQNISLDPTIFVDDERFLKNYNLKIYFASLLK